MLYWCHKRDDNKFGNKKEKRKDRWLISSIRAVPSCGFSHDRLGGKKEKEKKLAYFTTFLNQSASTVSNDTSTLNQHFNALLFISKVCKTFAVYKIMLYVQKKGTKYLQIKAQHLNAVLFQKFIRCKIYFCHDVMVFFLLLHTSWQ